MITKGLYLAHAGVLSLLGGAVTVAADDGKSGVARILEAIGINQPFPILLAGLLFAVAGGFVAMAHTPPEDRADKFGTLFAALLIGIFAAILHPVFPIIKSIPPQVAMGIAGLASRKIVDIAREVDLMAIIRKGSR